MPPAPRSTLFPYTTLFRSFCLIFRERYARPWGVIFRRGPPRRREKSERFFLDFRDFDFFADRKSTRLNSSHANISYAVFCLKKKRTTPSPPRCGRFGPSRL